MFCSISGIFGSISAISMRAISRSSSSFSLTRMSLAAARSSTIFLYSLPAAMIGSSSL